MSYNILIQYSTLLPQTRLYVVERNTGKVVETKYMSADTLFCFHHANAYEDKGNHMLSVKPLLYVIMWGEANCYQCQKHSQKKKRNMRQKKRP